MIRRVYVSGYKSLREVEIDLKPLTVFVGPNAVGKSNLFDALNLLAKMVTSKNLKTAFEHHRGAPLEAFSYNEHGIEGLIEQGQAQFTIEVDVELSPVVIEHVNHLIQQLREGISGTPKQLVRETLLRYSLTIEMMTEFGHLRVKDEKLQALNQDGSPRKTRNAFVERVGEKLHLRMEGQSHPTYHDLGVDHTLVSNDLYAPHYPHITAFKEELARWRFYYLEPRSMRSDTPVKEVDVLESSGSDLSAFYNTLRVKWPKQYDSLVRTLKAIIPQIKSVEVGPSKQGFLELEVVEAGIPYSSRVISEGTLRIMALLAIVTPSQEATLIGYEEPENGVHPRRIKLIADLLKNTVENGDHGRQALINTHSPILPGYFEETSLIKCKKDEQGTVFEPFLTAPLFKESEIDRALEKISLAEQIVRGDF